VLLVENMPNSDSKLNTEGWGDIDWHQVERYVFKLQTRIYAASRRGEVKKVRKLQRTLMRSWSNRVLAVRRVTQDNTGKNTAGVDGVKSLSPKARFKLVGQLRLTGKSNPTRRVWIPKPGKSEKRPLGIPTMYDRALQGVVKAVLEPEWEAHFEPNSFGFRPGRSCHDAIKKSSPEWLIGIGKLGFIKKGLILTLQILSVMQTTLLFYMKINPLSKDAEKLSRSGYMVLDWN
jgi:RNA-directed DNA polymerase